jgi:hypothetical protein
METRKKFEPPLQEYALFLSQFEQANAPSQSDWSVALPGSALARDR